MYALLLKKVCSDAYDENPLGEDVEYIRGAICSDDVLRRACVKDADFVIILGYTDEESILTTMAVDELNRLAFSTGLYQGSIEHPPH